MKCPFLYWIFLVGYSAVQESIVAFSRKRRRITPPSIFERPCDAVHEGYIAFVIPAKAGIRAPGSRRDPQPDGSFYSL
jgi:hypothetical protein